MRKCYVIFDLIHGMYHNPKAPEAGLSEGEWVSQIKQAFFYNSKQQVEQKLSNLNVPLVLNIVEVWVQPQ